MGVLLRRNPALFLKTEDGISLARAQGSVPKYPQHKALGKARDHEPNAWASAWAGIWLSTLASLGLTLFGSLGASLEKGFVEQQSTAKRKRAAALAGTPGFQVPNNHIVSKILPYIATINPSTVLLGPLETWGASCSNQSCVR